MKNFILFIQSSQLFVSSLFSTKPYHPNPTHKQHEIERERERERERESSKRIMGSEDLSSTTKLPLPLFITSHAQTQSPERSGMITPPLHTSVSVPFRWEQEPGKPKPCTALTTFTKPNNDGFAQKLLELPPRLLLDTKPTKLPSPTTVLEGPYITKSVFQSSSFRISGECYGSFRSRCSPERGYRGAMLLTNRGDKEKGLFGSWRRKALKGKREAGGGSYVFPSSVDRETDGCSREMDNSSGTGSNSSSSTNVKVTRINRAGSFPNLSHTTSHFWVSIYEGLKQVAVPWKSRKLKKEKIVN
ncbi:DUF688 domain-containing protein [Cephalotus follicularis]|uniref:DUF688 domain-containing protein n=1 Tax=Cephalotus follicularis TaxID=3775 RepID=A0A1Q3BJN3_CEPFO|nr:DUF688 domain-containing protein [Cephalotus follicularis]